MAFLKHSEYISCDILEKNVNEKGFFKTTEDNQIIKFINREDNHDYMLNSLRIFSKDMPLRIKINNSEGILHIDKNDFEGVEDLKIDYIQVLGLKGQELRYDGFILLGW